MATKRNVFGSIITRAPRPGYYTEFVWNGQRYRRSAGPTREAAKKKLSTAHALLSGGATIDAVLADVFGDRRGSRLTFRDASVEYLAAARKKKKASTVEVDGFRLGAICRAPWSGKYLVDIGADEIERWGRQRAESDVSGAAVNRDFSLISALFRWAARMRYCDTNPLAGGKVERFSERGRARETYLDPGEARALIAAADDLVRPVLLAAIHTGARRGELLSLQWRDVDLTAGSMTIRPEVEKSGRGRVVPLTPTLRAALADLKAKRQVIALDGSDPVFTAKAGAALPLTDAILGARLKAAVARCEAIPADKKPKVTFHALRHSAASMMVAAGVSLFDVGKILGHTSPQVTMRYAHFAPAAAKSAIDRLAGALADPTIGAGGSESARVDG
ncbi:MAG: site-specific integrase [Planctomycetes bacterium]|nr:site-specific integrase [Planctomycetota bacterium]